MSQDREQMLLSTRSSFMSEDKADDRLCDTRGFQMVSVRKHEEQLARDSRSAVPK
jgi:hypothetical protein